MPGYSILALILSILAFIFPQEQEVRFVSESIAMKIEKDHFSVSGIYYFENYDKNSIVLSYPFPVGPEFGAVDSVFMFNLSRDDTIKIFKSNPEGIVFSLDLEKDTVTELQIYYRQKLNSNTAKYIIKSTKAWRAPLESAYYQLIVPKDIRINQFSIFPDDSLNTGQEKVYYWKKFNFMPDKDMVFNFEVVREE